MAEGLGGTSSRWSSWQLESTPSFYSAFLHPPGLTSSRSLSLPGPLPRLSQTRPRVPNWAGKEDGADHTLVSQSSAETSPVHGPSLHLRLGEHPRRPAQSPLSTQSPTKCSTAQNAKTRPNGRALTEAGALSQLSFTPPPGFL